MNSKYLPEDNRFYAHYFHYFIFGIMATIALMIIIIGIVLYQVSSRPLPAFSALTPEGKQQSMVAYSEPNLLPETILKWASKAATAAYTFDFSNYRTQIEAARPYFTKGGWDAYLASVSGLVNTIVQNQVFVNGVVSGTPVISNQGPLPGKGYTWRVQIPFLVSYLSASGPVKQNYFVVLTIVSVPTNENPQGIGIDQFVMG